MSPPPLALLRRLESELDARSAALDRRERDVSDQERRLEALLGPAVLLGRYSDTLTSGLLAAALERVVARHRARLTDEDRARLAVVLHRG